MVIVKYYIFHSSCWRVHARRDVSIKARRGAWSVTGVLKKMRAKEAVFLCEYFIVVTFICINCTKSFVCLILYWNRVMTNNWISICKSFWQMCHVLFWRSLLLTNWKFIYFDIYLKFREMLLDVASCLLVRSRD